MYIQKNQANGEYHTELQGLDNVILTPHVGGSTEEAQKDIADFVPENYGIHQLRKYRRCR